MKLCPLFEKVMADSVYGEYEPEYRGAVRHCNDALPRKAIEAAIALMVLEANFALTPPLRAEYRKHIEQLRAMLPPSSPAA